MFNYLAQADYSYSYQTESSGSIPPVVIVLYLAIIALMIISMWKLFTKAGKPGWASIVPFYNTWVMLEIAGKPPIWFLLLFVPVVNLVVAVILYIEIAKRFGKSGWFAVVLLLLPFIGFPILGFGKARYTPAPGDAGAGLPPAPITPTSPTPPTFGETPTANSVDSTAMSQPTVTPATEAVAPEIQSPVAPVETVAVSEPVAAVPTESVQPQAVPPAAPAEPATPVIPTESPEEQPPTNPAPPTA
jgi:hypothetical protein